MWRKRRGGSGGRVEKGKQESGVCVEEEERGEWGKGGKGKQESGVCVEEDSCH